MTQPEIMNYLHQALVKNKLFESILFEGDNISLDELVNQLGRMLYCDNHAITNDQCQWCLSYENHLITDVKVIGDHYQVIDKETVLTMVNELNYAPLYLNKPKLRIIANVESLKPEGANALLKFLEEPTPNTYFFLLTNDQNQVLPTLESRAKLLTLTRGTNELDDNFLVEVISTKNKDNILLLNNKLKKMEKTKLQELVQSGGKHFLNTANVSIYELFLELSQDLKFSNNSQLAIDRFLIQITRVI
ncbi:hypothetical protein LD119_00462 [Mesoplasma sp. JKS002660]|uniref:hypothetical protein n=1 Tax=Mesoplasma whartonense TaxID=2878854 RepID=UPI002022A7AC|nr:hypothetical protein [Mesoplasma sp. JKS002660]MCL8213534.1 hypothetical protein [Mesoplasma sp. JKS002660]